MTTTTTDSASNGTAAATSTRVRAAGIGRVREAEAYHQASVARDAVQEAERLCSDIHSAASEPYFRRDDKPGETAQAMADPAIQKKISEAVQCLATAQQYLWSLGGGEPF